MEFRFCLGADLSKYHQIWFSHLARRRVARGCPTNCRFRALTRPFKVSCLRADYTLVNFNNETRAVPGAQGRLLAGALFATRGGKQTVSVVSRSPNKINRRRAAVFVILSIIKHFLSRRVCTYIYVPYTHTHLFITRASQKRIAHDGRTVVVAPRRKPSVSDGRFALLLPVESEISNDRRKILLAGPSLDL